MLRAEGAQLRAQYRYRDLAVDYVEAGSYRPPDRAIAMPLDALADFEGPTDSPVVLESTAPDRTVVRWDDPLGAGGLRSHRRTSRRNSAWPLAGGGDPSGFVWTTVCPGAHGVTCRPTLRSG